MKSQIWRSAGVLAFSGICAKSFDFAFRAFYSQRLGAEGMGLLSLGFGIHGVMLTVATAGLGVAVSKIVSEYLEEHQLSAVRQCMRLAIWGVACLGLAVMLLTFLGAEWMGTRILGDGRICAGLCCLVPSVLFMGISYCLKGYFYAARKVWIPASSEFLEQAVKFLSILLFLRWFLPKGIAYGCAAVFAGISIGEFSSCLYLSLFYLKESRHLQGGKEAQRVLTPLLQVSFPSMLSSLTGSSLRMQEEVFIVTALKRFGLSHPAAVSGLGIVHGMVMPMLVFPLTLMGSVTTLLVPEVARRNGIKQKERLQRLVSKVYRLGIGIGAVELLVFLLFAEPLATMVYRNTEIVPMLRTLSLLTPVMVLDTLSCAMLNGMGKQFFLLGYSVSDSLLRLAAIWLLVPRFGMTALVWVIAGSNLFTCALSIYQVKKNCGDVALPRKIRFFRREYGGL
ncbi:MAG: oligosaccharide flippase family protein [Clostridia bacterium]|nr:oligosaccharide flippase family protein [Clostridia bacterium]